MQLFKILIFMILTISSCSEKNGLNIEVENSPSSQNYYNIFSFSSSFISEQSNDLTLTIDDSLLFNKDSVIINLEVRKYSSGTGEINVFGNDDSLFFHETVNQLKEINDFQSNGIIPQRINIILNSYTGYFRFVLEGKD